ncbi:hypothetical protein GSF04_08160 [Pseudoalteromonas sp. A22]|uniref:hypothetical protein n=1 Tax=Pseudoalteromonas sp. A22 TaxID=327511 RepID=UPI001BA68EED|nr:hypothetical protein [Pseudoalteromonas sp. A22]QUI62489.1 hypothetical protein GSF04_08160 [Pseudoalteromonas sp. A22]
MENKLEYSFSSDDALKQFLSLEEQNCSEEFVDYEVTRDFVKKTLHGILADSGFLPKPESTSKES